MRMKVPIAVIVLVVTHTLSMFRVSAHPGSGIFVDEQGQIYFTDTGEGVWRSDTNRALSLFSKSALHWMAGSKEGHFTDAPEKFEHFERITPTGSKPVLLICSEFPCDFGRDGNLYYADTREGTRITRRTAAGQESVLVGASGQAPVLRTVTGIAGGPDDSLYIVDIDRESGDHAVLKIAMDGKVSTFSTGFLDAYPRKQSGRGDCCRGLAVDSDGNVFVAGTDRRCVVKITPQGKTSLALQASSPWFPTGVAVLRDELYVLEYTDMPPGWEPEDRKGWVPRVRKVERDGSATIVVTVPRQDTILRTK
jgi:sugar lactone lactonase YvrE